uniref:Uncharacterized protein n=1 Tax=Lotharella globosa TaxID=91324 RepID=A0A7S4DZ84_9EUKA
MEALAVEAVQRDDLHVQVPLGVREGEQFMIVTPEGNRFAVRVPPGARSGTVLRVNLPENAVHEAIPVGNGEVAEAVPVAAPPLRPPEGHWRDGICCCCYNIIPSCLLAFTCWCFPYARIRNKEVLEEPSCGGWPGFKYFGNLFMAFSIWVLLLAGNVFFRPTIGLLLGFASGLYIYVIWKTRSAFRQNNRITEHECFECVPYECEDCCFSCVCPCLVIAQMDRHAFARTRVWECERCSEALGPPENREFGI